MLVEPKINTHVAFSVIEIGDVFQYGNNHCIKINEIISDEEYDESSINAITLETGQPIRLTDYTPVIYKKMKLVEV